MEEKYFDPILNKEFSYKKYNNISSEEIIEMFEKETLNYEKFLYERSTIDWLNKKARMYGIAISKPELFDFVYASIKETPIWWYDIKLKDEYFKPTCITK